MKHWIILLIASLGIATLPAQPRYDYGRLQMEKLNRGVIAIRENASTVVVSWRYLSSDPANEAFDIYRNGLKINKAPVRQSTFFKDNYKGTSAATYTVMPVKGKLSGTWRLPADAPDGYLNIPLQRPQNGVTPAGEAYSYSPNDASVGDVDGDGEYEIVLKWDPSNAHDNSHSGYTGNVFIDCYKLSGKRLWRIDMGKNIRAGAHYTQFMVYDFDNDGRAEVIMRTSDGTVDGCGKTIGNPSADYREKEERNQGRILTGKEYLTVFNGQTGAALQSIDYIPPRGNPQDWGDARANRSDRFLAAVAYLDGRHPSVIMCRGYYTRSVLAAFDWNGKTLQQRWVFDSNSPGNAAYAGQGDHSLRIGDLDGDGCDEIVYGAMVVDNNGKGLYSTGLGHGDALHLTQFDPDSPRLQVWSCHEDKKDGSVFRDALTGKILFQVPDKTDVGRCMAADIDPTNRGVEMWSPASHGIRSFNGDVTAAAPKGLSCNFGIWWDGDLLRELLDRNCITKYNWKDNCIEKVAEFTGCTSNNGTKAVPCLSGDIIGDWREEVLLRTEDNTALHLYVSPIATPYRFHSFMEEPVYRISVATENVAYNQPPQPGFYFGPDLKGKLCRGTAVK